MWHNDIGLFRSAVNIILGVYDVLFSCRLKYEV